MKTNMAAISTSANTTSANTSNTGDWYDNTWSGSYTPKPIIWKQIQDAMKQGIPTQTQTYTHSSFSTEQLLAEITKKLDALALSVNALCEVLRTVLEARNKQLEQPHE